MIDNITIGRVLKEVRKSLGLTQKEFTHGVVTTSFYSKVERGVNKISTVDFFKILILNKVDEDEILKKIVSEDNHIKNKSDLKVQLLAAFNEKDKEKAALLNDQIQKSNMDENIKISALLINSVMNNKIGSLTQMEKNKIKRKFYEVENWADNISTLQLFSNSMLIFDFDELEYYMKQILKTDIKNKPINTQRVISTICINYFYNCYLNKKYDSAVYGFKIIDSLAPLLDFGIFKIVASYYKAIFSSDDESANEIISFLNKYGAKEVANGLPKCHI
ncbi:helix-turn-helix transcriptional regulator [uncultured Lactobacillus sp.]|uniref:helix-turn-helix domain-containing protein n=1 Tax=uncultured Lactobacillus sp. TaxID=153152 RepID=UPI00280586C6|nr:helix-turn-helix transcriptional regulator [uncultured Lactobacillus sp.]